MIRNLVPSQPGTAPSYWCTWGAQGSAFALNQFAFGLEGHLRNVEVLTEANLFGPNGWVSSRYFDPIKADLYVVYDVGWDVPYVAHLNGKDWKYWLGSMIVAEDKFPSCTGTPAERLRKLNELTQTAGWRGAGLWLHAETAPSVTGKTDPSMEEMENYFRERARWCREAEIEYWKVDYGRYCADLAFREMLTRVAREEYPALVVEHARNGGPFNDQYCPWDQAKLNHSGTFRAWGDGEVLATSAATIKFSAAFRAYDLSHKLSNATMLDRIAELLRAVSNQSEVNCIINCEDEPYIGAATGCAIGIMHSSLEKVDKRGNHLRALRWQRIASPFGAGLGETILDSERLEDSWRYQPGDDWVDWMNGKTVIQSAPARVARNMPLPQVSVTSQEAPFVLCCRFPNGATAVATRGRVTAEKGAFFPLADVTLECGEPGAPVGIFGYFNRLTLQFSSPVTGRRVFAQDLAADQAEEITSQVRVDGEKVILEGSLITRLGKSIETSPQDESEPGMVILIE